MADPIGDVCDDEELCWHRCLTDDACGELATLYNDSTGTGWCEKHGREHEAKGKRLGVTRRPFLVPIHGRASVRELGLDHEGPAHQE